MVYATIYTTTGSRYTRTEISTARNGEKRDRTYATMIMVLLKRSIRICREPIDSCAMNSGTFTQTTATWSENGEQSATITTGIVSATNLTLGCASAI